MKAVLLDQLVTVRRFRDIPDALLAQGKVQSAGIECVLADGNLVRMDWLYSNLIGGLRLQVNQADVEDATAILDEPIPAELQTDASDGPYVQPACPRCDSLDVGFETINHFWSYGLWLVLSFPIPIRKQNWKCYACLAEWIEDDEVSN